jgi:Icc-related predicted phosphoesterase
VVVTHHAPHPNSVHPRFAGNAINAAFVSDLGAAMGSAVLWIHGHTHDSFDYTVRGTRVVANPRGYCRKIRSDDGGTAIVCENAAFDPGLVVEV